jgi:glycine cleavage system aminomethyltransferase T
MAYVPAALAHAGTEVQIDVRGRDVPATLAGIPFYRRSR